MNKLVIIGNLTRDPETFTTGSGINGCNFTVAVNKRVKDKQHPESWYFRVTAWRALGDTCAKYLAKGRRVCVVGQVDASAYAAQDGGLRASLEVTAEDVEFLSPRSQEAAGPTVVDNAEAEQVFGGDGDTPY